MSHFDKITSFPIIPVIVIEDADVAEPLAEALLEGGLKIIEVTFRTEAAGDAIQKIVNSFPDMVVGAGTVVSLDQAKRAIDAGSQFGLAPGTDPDTISYFQSHNIPFIPGTMTPSDVQVALKHNCNYLKFFPAGAAGGPKLLKAMAAPYLNRGVQFCPTGGVSLENMNEYLKMKEVFAVGGSWLATKDQISNGDWGVISANVRAALERAHQ
jgi:2-dehydro-3-deoxyphosphogluconate aldolase/(4S)-4-hydroxy-2-oxoglutarate aldolase